MKAILMLFVLVAFNFLAQAQTDWKLVNERNGIKVYMTNTASSRFKSIRVQAVFEGTIRKLMKILGEVPKHTEWIYKTKSAVVLQQLAPYEFVYYTESILPWPLTNRDAIIHLTMVPDSNHRLLKVTAISEPEFIAQKEGLVRIPFSKGIWYVTEVANHINIDYIFEVDPGGELPAWLVNSLADKGPMETFQNLRSKLRL